MANYLRTELVLDALNIALWQRKPEAVVHHSNQRTQYTSIAFSLGGKEVAVRPSIGSPGDCYDNTSCERFFATLECELLDRRRFRTQAEAKMAVDLFEIFYNPARRNGVKNSMFTCPPKQPVMRLSLIHKSDFTRTPWL